MENIIEQWVASARRHTNINDLQVGVDISPYPQIKIAFDGYAEDDDEVEDLNMESYAVYIHKEAADTDFVFPPHEATHWSIVQRPAEELCHFVWYDVQHAEYSGPALAESAENSEVAWDDVEQVINQLNAMHSS